MSADEERTEMNVGDDSTEQEGGQGVFKVPEPMNKVEIEKEQEAKLKAKYGGLKKPGGGSALLQKRLQKGQKYFDSGDYNMAKAKMNNPKRPLAPKEKLLLQESIGGAIPTPTEVENLRRPSQIASKLLIEGDGADPN